MRNTEKRVAALEASALDDTMKVIIIQDGETQAEASERFGLSRNTLCVVFGMSLDALL